MKNKKHIKSFNEVTENLNISDISDSKTTAEEILKNCKRYFIESGYRTSDTVILLDDAIDAIYNFLDKNK